MELQNTYIKERFLAFSILNKHASSKAVQE